MVHWFWHFVWQQQYISPLKTLNKCSIIPILEKYTEWPLNIDLYNVKDVYYWCMLYYVPPSLNFQSVHFYDKPFSKYRPVLRQAHWMTNTQRCPIHVLLVSQSPVHFALWSTVSKFTDQFWNKYWWSKHAWSDNQVDQNFHTSDNDTTISCSQNVFTIFHFPIGHKVKISIFFEKKPT